MNHLIDYYKRQIIDSYKHAQDLCSDILKEHEIGCCELCGKTSHARLVIQDAINAVNDNRFDDGEQYALRAFGLLRFNGPCTHQCLDNENTGLAMNRLQDIIWAYDRIKREIPGLVLGEKVSSENFEEVKNDIMDVRGCTV